MAIDPELLRLVHEDPDKPVSVVVALDRPTISQGHRTRQQLIEDRRAAFESVSAKVRGLIDRVGGAVTDEAWLSSSLRVTLPAGALPAVDAADGVRAVGIPPQLVREAGEPAGSETGVTRS